VSLPDNPQQQLEWEARQRPRAAIAAAAAAVFVFGGQIASQAALQDAPRSDVLQSFENLQAPGSIDDRPSLLAERAQYISDHAVDVVIPSAVSAIGYIALAYALTFLAAATRARRAQFPKVALYLPAIGGVLMGVVALVGTIGFILDQNAFLDGPRTVETSQDLGLGTLAVIGQVVLLPGALCLATAYVLVSLNAMRAGLLTRFMGILGVLVGTFVIIQIAPFPIVQTFWLLGLAIVLAGRRPGGDPPAWRTGREEPWPSPQQVAEERRRAAGAQPEPEPEAEPEPASVAAGGAQHPSSQKRRRKRRR
jgi:hypothetical protein